MLTSDPAEEGRRTGGNTHTHYDHSGSNPEFADTVNFVAHENTAAHLASTDCDDGMGFEGGSIKNCERFQGENMFARKGLPFIDAANSNGRATEFLSSYSVSDRYRDFEAPANDRAARSRGALTSAGRSSPGLHRGPRPTRAARRR